VPSDLLFTVTKNVATPASAISLADAGLRERRDLQEWILAHPEILGEDIMVVTFEFDRWWAQGAAPADRLDVLGLGSDGRLVVVELKRDKAPDTVEMQAVKYAAMASRFTPESLSTQHSRFLGQRGQAVSEDEALQRLVTHAGELDVENLRRPRLVIVAGDFPPVVTATTVWLTEMGLDITLMQVRAFRTANETLIHVSQLFPVRNVEEFTVSPRQAEVKAVEERRRRQRDAVQLSVLSPLRFSRTALYSHCARRASTPRSGQALTTGSKRTRDRPMRAGLTQCLHRSSGRQMVIDTPLPASPHQ